MPTSVPHSGDPVPVLLVSDERANVAIRVIAEAWLRELLAFGRLNLALRPPREKVEAYIAERVSPAISLLTLLESVAGLRFASWTEEDTGVGHPHSRGLAYCYNRQHWASDAPVAGYSDALPAPLPHQVVMSLAGNWLLDSGDGTSTSSRLTYAALWTCHTEGLEAAINLLFDLQQQGFIGDTGAITSVVLLILRGREAAGSIDEMVLRFFGGPAPATAADWIEADLAVDWINMDSPAAGSGPVLDSLIAWALSLISTVRHAQTLDEWTVGQCDVVRLLKTLDDLVAHAGIEVPVGVQAVLSQFHEIAADAFSDVMTQAVGFAWLETRIGYVQLLGTTLQASFGDGWRDQLFHERLVVPAALRSTLLDLADNDVPDGWSQLSWRLAHPFCTLFRSAEVPMIARAVSLDADLLLADSEVRHLFQRLDIGDPEVQRAVVNAEIGHGSSELAASLSYPKEDVAAALEDADRRLRADELLDALRQVQKLADVGSHQLALESLEEWCAVYPWSAPLLYERAIAHDELGDPRAALGALVAALALRPLDPNQWRSLRVVLRHLGHEEEAELAGLVHRYIEAMEVGPPTEAAPSEDE